MRFAGDSPDFHVSESCVRGSTPGNDVVLEIIAGLAWSQIPMGCTLGGGILSIHQPTNTKKPSMRPRAFWIPRHCFEHLQPRGSRVTGGHGASQETLAA